jgi:two-component system, NarL family, sensor kinase
MDSKETKAFTLLLIVFVTLGVIISYFILSIVRQHRRNLKLQQAMFQSELKAMERERERIAADLHDEISPLLAVVKFQVDSVEGVQGEEAEHLRQASLYVDDVLHRIREISNNLMPASLLKKGLRTVLWQYMKKVEKTTGLSIHFECADDPLLSQELCVNVYRILQEIIHNTVKHAGASTVWVRLTVREKMLHLYTRDNGRGFDYPTINTRSAGIGLHSLKNRAESLGGRMQVESAPGSGTAFLFTLPSIKENS